MLPIQIWYGSLPPDPPQLRPSGPPGAALAALRRRIGDGLIWLGHAIAADNGRRIAVTNGR